MRQIAAATAGTGVFIGAILMSYRPDMKTAKEHAEDTSKVPKIMQRASINEFMKNEPASAPGGKLVKRPSGSMAVFTEGGPALGGAESGAAN